MDAMEAIRNRRSIRRYLVGAIPRDDLETIVDAGRLAATGSNRQPWDFIIVTEKPMIDNFKVANSWIVNASAVIVVVMNPISPWWREDGAAAIENMLLASTALGYGSCWVEGEVMPYEDLMKSLLGIPADRIVKALIPIGIPAETPQPKKKTLEEILHWERF